MKAVKVHLNEHAEARACGGEAVVHIFEWHGPGGGSAGEGECVALKVYHLPDGRGGVKPVMSNDDARAEGGSSSQQCTPMHASPAHLLRPPHPPTTTTAPLPPAPCPRPSMQLTMAGPRCARK